MEWILPVCQSNADNLLLERYFTKCPTLRNFNCTYFVSPFRTIAFAYWHSLKLANSGARKDCIKPNIGIARRMQKLVVAEEGNLFLSEDRR